MFVRFVVEVFTRSQSENISLNLNPDPNIRGIDTTSENDLCRGFITLRPSYSDKQLFHSQSLLRSASLFRPHEKVTVAAVK